MSKDYSLRLAAGLTAVFLLFVTLGSFANTRPEMLRNTARDTESLPLNGSVRNLLFVQNAGQWNPAVGFCAQGSGSSVWFTNHGYYAVFYDQEAPVRPSLETSESPQTTIDYLTLKVAFEGASHSAALTPLGEIVSRQHFLKGAQSQEWITHVPCYHSIVVEDLYPGIGIRYYSSGQALEFDFLVEAGADPDQIGISYDGIESMSLNDSGDLILTTAWGDVIQHSPVVYQQVGYIRNEIPCNYRLMADNTFGFEVGGDYIPGLPLVIDPVLSFATFLGGGNSSAAYDVTVDGDQNVIVTGATASTDFPDTNALQGTMGGGSWDAFVAKLSGDGQSLLYSTYLGGSASDYGYAVVADSDGAVYLCGRTTSLDFPTQNPIFPVDSSGDAFVVKLAADGSSLVYGTYLGGSGADYAWDIDLAGDSSAVVAGYTISADFPILSAYQDSLAGAYDVFVTKINGAGSALAYSTFLGGESIDIGQAVSVDANGRAYLVGYTMSTDFPTVAAYQSGLSSAGKPDLFVSRLTSTGNVLSYSTYLGGEGSDYGAALELGVDGSIYVLGRSLSFSYPLVNAYQTSRKGESDVVLSRLNASGSALLYSTYLGGTGDEFPGGLGVDNSGRMFVIGHCSSTDFPSRNAFQPAYGGGTGDVFIARFQANGSQLDYATYLGGSAGEEGHGIAVNDEGYAWIAGSTGSADFPVRRPLQATLGGNTDALIGLITGDCVDSDEDGLCDTADNCPNDSNPLQEDFDNDGVGDSCDVCPLDSLNDADGDGHCANVDNCPGSYNPGQDDSDGDGVGTLCDLCPEDFDPLQEDFDDDGIGDSCDVCPHDFFNDYDNDGWCGDVDNCPGVANPDQLDTDSNGIGDLCENCCVDFTGNADCSLDDQVTMGDLTVLIDHLFVTYAPLCCPPEANTDGSADDEITMGDLTAIIDHLFISYGPLPPCN